MYVAGKYPNLPSFERDFTLIYENCLAYNPPGNPWHDACKWFRDRAKSALDYWKRTNGDVLAFDEAFFKVPKADVDAAADRDDDVMGLCVWSFPDTPVEDQYPCYMMALDLKPETRGGDTAGRGGTLVARGVGSRA